MSLGKKHPAKKSGGFSSKEKESVSAPVEKLRVRYDQPDQPPKRKPVDHPKITWFAEFSTYFSYAFLILVGHIRDFLGKCTGRSRYFGGNATPKRGYAPLLQDWENFFTRRLYHRIQDAWNRPIVGPPRARRVAVMERTSKDHNCTLDVTGKTTDCVNLASYNYLGFADDWDVTCKSYVLSSVGKYAVNMSSSRSDAGITSLHRMLEKMIANFVGKEDAVVFPMGYITNTSGLPSLLGKGCLIISDSLNHASIVTGSRASGAEIKVFNHNDVDHLESLLRESIISGQPRIHRPWNKIVVVVEGVYSMEGDVCNLRQIVNVVKKYKAYIYLDEAHSIGAMGRSGRGICEHAGVHPSEVDILMGTFTKSFGAMGGYIAANKNVVEFLKRNSQESVYGPTMPPTVASQVIACLKVIQGDDGTTIGRDKVAKLRENSDYLRKRLTDIGCHVYGQSGSPVIPIMIYNPAKIAFFSRLCLQRGVAAVVVGFPATPLVMARARFCVSAGHTIEDLEKAIGAIDEAISIAHMKFAFAAFG